MTASLLAKPFNSNARAARTTRCTAFLAVIFAALTFVFATAAAQAESFKTDWLSPTWTPCEDVGVNGTARYFYEAQQQFSSPNATMKITSIAVYGSSASFTAADSFLTVNVAVIKGGKTLDSVNLIRPTGATIEPAPGATETRRLYLPNGKTLSVPVGATLAVSVSAAKNNCSINNSTHTIDPFTHP